MAGEFGTVPLSFLSKERLMVVPALLNIAFRAYHIDLGPSAVIFHFCFTDYTFLITGTSKRTFAFIPAISSVTARHIHLANLCINFL